MIVEAETGEKWSVTVDVEYDITFQATVNGRV